MLNIKHISLTIFLLFTSFTFIYAQNNSSDSGNSRVRGTITDALSGESLIGVNVSIKGTSIGSPTDIDGKYIIRRVPSGSHTLVISYVGYETVEALVELEAGETLVYDAELTQETVEGSEVTISAQREGQQEAINQQITSNKIVNVVSETKIQELPDFNAASALGRLPGVSTTKSSGEDNKVIIRGLSPEYNSIEIEGVKLSATGSPSIGFTSDVYTNTGGVSNDRSVDLTSVSPYMIRMISVYKSLTPDMNANSIGGTVNMELREAPSDVHWSAMFQQGYTAKSNTIGNYRAVASGSNRFFSDKLGVYGLVNIESYDRNSDNMNANYGRYSSVIDSTTGFRPVTVNQVTFNRHTETRNRYGANLILDYRLPEGSIKFLNLYTRINSDYIDYNQSIGYNDGRMNWRLQQGDNIIDQQLHSLKLDYDFNWITMDLSASYTAAHNLLDDSPVINFNQTSAVTITDERVNETPENLLSLQDTFQGVDQIILRSGNLFTSDYKEEKFTYKADFEIPFNIDTRVSGSFKFGGQFDNQSNSLDQEAPYMGFDGNATSDDENIANNMMAALMQEYNLGVNGQGAFTGPSFLNSKDDLFDPFLGDKYGDVYYIPRSGILINMLNYVIGNPLYDASNSLQSTGRQGGWYDGPFQQLTNDYSFDEDYYATYAMTQFTVGDLFLIGGVRYEKVVSNYHAYNAEDIRNAQTQYMLDTTSTSENEFLLPMGQMRYSPFSWMDLRYAYTQTLARPDYNQLSPKFTIPNGGGSISTGNPDLKPAKAFNHDVNITFHSNKLGLLSVGAFYKTIENFVYGANYSLDVAETAGIDQASNYQIFCNQNIRDRYGNQYPVLANCSDGQELVSPSPNSSGKYVVTVNKPLNNPYNAIVRGLELDFQHNFWYLPAPFSNMVFGVNYARIFSDYKQPFYLRGEEFVIPPGGGRPERVNFLIDSTFTGRLANQPNHVLNTYIGYDYKGFSGRFSVLFQSNSAGGGNGRYPENDVFSGDYLKLDFSARQKLPFADGGAELFMDVSNLSAANTQWRQRSLGGFQRIENYGLTANIGLRIRY